MKKSSSEHDGIDADSALHMTLRWHLVRVAGALLALNATAAAVAILALQFWWPCILLVAIVAELCFPVYLTLQYRRLNIIPVPLGPHNVDHWLVFNRFIHGQEHIAKFLPINKMLTTWFFNAPLEDIKFGNVGDLLAYGFWYKSRADCIAAGDPDLPDRLTRMLEHAWGVTFPPGHTPDLRFMAHLWHPVKCDYRPLFTYLITECLSIMAHVALAVGGFSSYGHHGMRYHTLGLPAQLSIQPDGSPAVNDPTLFISSVLSDATSNGEYAPPSYQDSSTALRRRVPVGSSSSNNISASNTTAASPLVNGSSTIPQPQSTAAEPAPLLFFHGVGLGLLPYVPFLLRLACSGRPMVLVETRHLSMRLCSRVLRIDEVVDQAVALLKALGIPRVSIVSHSYGTFMASRLLQRYPSKVHSLALVDPVCLGMYTGKLVKNFVYTPLQSLKAVSTWFVAREPLHAASVQRGFHWTELNLWPELLPPHSLVVLAAQDPLVPAQEARVMLQNESPHTQIMWHPTHAHATFLTDIAWQEDLAVRIEQQASAADRDHRALKGRGAVPVVDVKAG